MGYVSFLYSALWSQPRVTWQFSLLNQKWVFLDHPEPSFHFLDVRTEAQQDKIWVPLSCGDVDTLFWRLAVMKVPPYFHAFAGDLFLVMDALVLWLKVPSVLRLRYPPHHPGSKSLLLLHCYAEDGTRGFVAFFFFFLVGCKPYSQEWSGTGDKAVTRFSSLFRRHFM